MAPYYNNPGQVNDEAINIAGGKTFQVVQLADVDGNVVDPGGGGESGGSSSTTPTTTSVASSATSVQLAGVNANRKGLSIFNNSTAPLTLSFSTPATSANAFLVLGAGAFILLDQQLIFTNAVYGLWSMANGTAQVTEFV